MEDYYELLEVHPKASPEVIARAYRVLVSRYHPDLHPPERRDWAEEMMKRVNEAYGTLGEEKKRSAYDKARKPLGTPQPAGVASAPSSNPSHESHRNVTVADVRVCAFHPTRSRVSTCLNCRRSLCSQCRVLQEGRPFCPDCAKTIGANQESNNSMSSSRSLTHDGPGRTRLAQRPMLEWVLILLSASVFAVWLFWGVGPLLIHEIFMLWVVVSICIASGFLLAFALSLVPRIKNPAFWNSLSWSCRISAFVVAALLLAVGVRMDGVAFAKIARKIYEGNAKRQRVEQTAHARQHLQNFVNVVKPNKTAPRSLWQKASDKVWQTIDPTEEDDQQEGEPNAESAYPFPGNMEGRDFNIAYQNAKDYLNSDYSGTQDQVANRRVCLHFLVWAALEQKTSHDVTKEAKECLTKAPTPSQKVDCHYYLAKVAYERKDLPGLQTHREELAKIVTPNDQKLAEVDSWINSLQLNNLRTLISKCDPKAKDEGLKMLTPEFAQRDPEAFEKMAFDLGKCLHKSKDSEGLKHLNDQYLKVSSLQRYKTQFQEWIDTPEPAPEIGNQGDDQGAL